MKRFPFLVLIASILGSHSTYAQKKKWAEIPDTIPYGHALNPKQEERKRYDIRRSRDGVSWETVFTAPTEDVSWDTSFVVWEKVNASDP